MASRLTPIQWLICAIAAIGFAFDIYELLMLPLIIKPAIASLSAPLVEQLVAGGMPRPQAMALWVPGGSEYVSWARTLFFVPAMVGGVFGLLGGYLTDRLGRRRVLTFSILLYALSAFAAGFVTSLPQLLVLRCAVFVGVCVEFVAAVAWLAELFPEREQRETVLGYTQAFSSFGGLLVSAAYYVAVTYGSSLPAIHGDHHAWRYTLISGLIPAIPLIVIRPFLPESPAWQQKKDAGTLRRPSIAELFHPSLRRATIVTTIMFACSYGAAFGAIQHLPRIVPGLTEVSALARPAQQQIVSAVQMYQEVGGLVGRFILAFLAIRILTKRGLLRIFQVPGMIMLPLVFLGPAMTDLTMLKYGIFLVGLLTVAQFSFWGNYLPLVYPTHLRGTGEAFAANVGGRMIGTSAALVTTSLTNVMPGAGPAAKLAYAAAVVGTSVYVIGFIASFWLPEPKGDRLQD
jgi:MFS family permease